MKNTFKINLTTRGQLTVLIIIASILVAIGGYFIYSYQANKILQAKEKTLTAIATLKSKQLSHWFLDELNDIQIITNDSYLTEEVKKTLRSNSLADKSRLTKYLSQIKNEHDYKDVIIATADEKLEIWDGEQGVLNEAERRTIEKAYLQKKTLSTDLFRHKSNGEENIIISFISVIKDADNNVLAALIGRHDVTQTIYPIIDEWPTPSQTAESYLFRLEADSILYLNNLKHNNNAALNLRIPAKNTELFASLAVSGKLGLVVGKDYRNEDVTGFISKIEGTPWYLISKIDDNEMYQGKYVIAGVVAGLELLLIFIITFFIEFIYKRKQKNIFKELYSKEKEVWQQQEKFKVTMDSLGEGVIVTDMDAKVQYINKHAEALTGWRFSDALGRKLGEVYPVKSEETGEKENNILEKVKKHGIVKEIANHTLLVSKNGKEIPVMDTGAPIFGADGSLTGIVISFQDETEKRVQNRLIKESEQNLREFFENDISGDYAATADGEILRCNTAFARILGYNSSDELVGRNLFEFYRDPVDREDFLKMIQASKTLSDIELSFKHKDGSEIFCMENIVGVFDESGSLVKYFGYLQDITRRKKAEEELFRSEELLHLTGDIAKVGGWELDLQTNLLRWTSQTYRIHEVDPAIQPSLETAIDFYAPEARPIISAAVQKAITEGVPWDIELPFITVTGRNIWVRAMGVPLFKDDKCVRLSGAFQDITMHKLAEEKLVLLNRAVEASSVSVVITDVDGNINYVNPYFTELTGYSLVEVLGKNLRFLKSGNQPKTFYEELWNTILSGKDWTGEIQNRKKNGALYWEKVLISPILNSKGKVTNFNAIKEDITERKKMFDELIKAKEKAEESERKLQLINEEIAAQNEELNQANQKLIAATEKAEINEHKLKEAQQLAKIGNWELDLINNKLDWSDEVFRIMGCEPQQFEATYEVFLSYIHPDDRDLVDNEYANHLKTKQPYNITHRMLLTNGVLKYVKEQCISDFDENGNLIRSIGTVADITESKKAEHEIIKAKEKAEESDKLKTAFINNISHEIRTPLNAIMGFGQIMAESELSKEEREEFFKHVEKSSNRLIDTVTDYMDIAMLVSNTMKVNKKEFALEPVFEMISEKTKSLCIANDIKFEVEIPFESKGLIVNSDPEFIKKILDKLLNNALKFTKEGNIICGYKIKTEYLEFFVKDTGSGINNDMQDLIFEMFRQADVSNTRGYEGSGLGLTIAKGLVTLLGGEIFVASEKGKGSEFTFKIPINNAEKVNIT